MWISVLVGCVLVGAAPRPTAPLRVVVQGVRSDLGSLRLAVFDAKRTFPNGTAFRGVSARANVGSVELELDDLPPGDYALAVYHDANDNQKLDTGWFGIPREAFGFSNNPRISFGTPSFESARIKVTGKPQTLTIELKHF